MYMPILLYVKFFQATISVFVHITSDSVYLEYFIGLSESYVLDRAVSELAVG